MDTIECRSAPLFPADANPALKPKNCDQRLILVDDKPLIIQSIRYLFEKENANIRIDDCKSMNLLYSVSPNKYDFILISYGIADINDLADFRRHNPEIRFAVISSQFNKYVASDILRLGATGFIPMTLPETVIYNTIYKMMMDEHIFRGYRATVPERYPASSSANHMHSLSARQREVLRKLSLGLSNKHIARDLEITESTVKMHLKAVYKNLGVKTRTQAISKIMFAPQYNVEK